MICVVIEMELLTFMSLEHYGSMSRSGRAALTGLWLCLEYLMNYDVDLTLINLVTSVVMN